MKLQKLQSIQRDFALLSTFTQRILTSPERYRMHSDIESGNYGTSSPSNPSIASCSPVDSFSTINVNPLISQDFSPPTGYTSADQKTLRMNLPEPGLTNANISQKRQTPTSSFSFRSMPAKNSEDLNYSNDMSTLTRCATGITPPTFAYRPEPVSPNVLGEESQSEAGELCYEFPDLQISDIDIST